MTRHWHPVPERIVRWVKPFAGSLATAAAAYRPDVMLQLDARRRGALPAPPFSHEVHVGDRTPALGQRRPVASDRMGWPDGSDGGLGGARRCPAR